MLRSQIRESGDELLYPAVEERSRSDHLEDSQQQSPDRQVQPKRY